MTQMFKSEDSKDAVDFANAVLKRYTAIGFGALSKREVDLMMLQLLQDHLPGFRECPDYDAAIRLRTTKRKIRGLKDEIAYREGHQHSEVSQKSRLREILLNAEILSDNQGIVRIQIDDAALRGYAENMVRSDYGIVDSSFNSAIMTLSGEKFLFLAYKILDQKDREKADKVISEIYNDEKTKPSPEKSAFKRFKDGFVLGAGQRTGQLCVSGAMALLSGGTSLILEGVEPMKEASRGIAKALKQAREFFTRKEDS